MNLPDRYTDVKGLSVVHPGWSGNIMVTFYGVVDERNIDEILKINGK